MADWTDSRIPLESVQPDLRRGAGRTLCVLVSAVLLASSCAAPPEAPAELSDLSRYLLRGFDDADPRVLEAGIENLAVLLADVDLDGSRADRGFAPDDLQEEDLSDIPHPDAPVADCLPVALAGRSPHAVQWFGRYGLIVDQSPAEPTAASYERQFLEPDAPECFGELECSLMRTSNQIQRSTAIYTVNYVLLKDFRWVDLHADGEPTGRRALLTRAWMEDSAEGVNGQNTIVQSYTLDAFIEADDETTWRYHALYSQADLAVPVDDDVTAGTIRLSIDNHFAAHDAAIADTFSLESR